MPQLDKIGWIGLGEMGVEMASNLHKYLQTNSQESLTVWNRTPEKTTRLANEGATVASSIEELLARTNIIFTSLSNDAAVESVYETLFSLVSKRQDPVIFVETSTVYPTLPQRLQTELAAFPQHAFLQCPIFGRPPAAAAAQLVWIASGDAKVIEHLTPYFKSMSRAILDLHTTDVSRASAFKLLGNFWVVGSIELLAEGLALGGKNQLAQADVLKLVELLFPSPVWLGYSKLIVDQVENKAGGSAGFPVTLGLKDVRHMQKLAQDSGAELPTADVAYKNLKTVEERGLGGQDWTTLIQALL
ncbi:hypothetical protein BGZ83_006181 [Gryganskiella cystojenkinii]|nr:hypothetical protein BGZ83_006181 [Gryganskiella cystojenkinii]